MRRRGLWALCVVLLVGVGVVAVGAGFAKHEDAGAQCSEATLNGRYLFAYDGVELQEGKDQVPIAVAGQQVFDGNGKQHGVSSVNLNGKISRKQPFSGTYRVNADCTGTTTTNRHESDLFIAPDGSMFTFVQIKPKSNVTSGFELQGTAKRVGD
jgi:hypothetical protein